MQCESSLPCKLPYSDSIVDMTRVIFFKWGGPLLLDGYWTYERLVRENRYKPQFIKYKLKNSVLEFLGTNSTDKIKLVSDGIEFHSARDAMLFRMYWE